MTTAPTIQNTEFAARRRALMDSIGHDGVAVIAASAEAQRNSDVHYDFRQHSDFVYLTGFHEPDAWLVLAPGHDEGEVTLFVRPKDPERELWDGYREGPQGVVANYGADRGEVIADLDRLLPKLLADRKRVFYNLGQSMLHDRRMIRWLNAVKGLVRTGVSAPQVVESLVATLAEQRLIKSPQEAEMMRYAGKISAEAHCVAMQMSPHARNEFELDAAIRYHFAKHGMEPAYGTIVGAGANACVLHYNDNNAPLNPDELCLIDAGGEHHCYAADITRTFPVGGRFSGPQRDIYQAVLEAQKAAIEAVKPGALYNDPHEAAVKSTTQSLVDLGVLEGDVDALIEDQKYTSFFMHKTGHWLGLDVHDVGQYKIDGQWRAFQPGMALTIEPGLYFAANNPDAPEKYHNIGIRIEDDLLVTEAGSENLTEDAPKSIDEIENLMAG